MAEAAAIPAEAAVDTGMGDSYLQKLALVGNTETTPFPGDDQQKLPPVPRTNMAKTMFTAHRVDDIQRSLAHCRERLGGMKDCPPSERKYHLIHVNNHLSNAIQQSQAIADNLKRNYPEEYAELRALLQTMGLAQALSPEAKVATFSHLLETIMYDLGHAKRHALAMEGDPSSGKEWDFDWEHAAKHVNGAIEHGHKLAQHIRDNYPAEAAYLDGLQVSPDADPLTIKLTPETPVASTVPKPIGRPDGPGLWKHKHWMLPPYIQHVAHALMRHGHGESDAIHMAVGIVKHWAEGHDGHGHKTHPDVRAAAAANVGKWEELRARAAASHAAKAGKRSDHDLAASYHCEVEEILALAAESKLSHAAVEFEHPAKGPHHCGECQHRTATGCEIVADPIEDGDWCDRFKQRALQASQPPGENVLLAGVRKRVAAPVTHPLGGVPAFPNQPGPLQSSFMKHGTAPGARPLEGTLLHVPSQTVQAAPPLPPDVPVPTPEECMQLARDIRACGHDSPLVTGAAKHAEAAATKLRANELTEALRMLKSAQTGITDAHRDYNASLIPVANVFSASLLPAEQSSAQAAMFEGERQREVFRKLQTQVGSLRDRIRRHYFHGMYNTTADARLSALDRVTGLVSLSSKPGVGISRVPGLSGDSTMIYVIVPPDLLPAGYPPELPHITVVYCGHTTPEQFALICERAKGAAKAVPPMHGSIGGLQFFEPGPSSEGRRVAYAPIFMPGLYHLRSILRDLAAPESVPTYVPHCTLAYLEPDEPLPPPVGHAHLCCSELFCKRGDEIHGFALTGPHESDARIPARPPSAAGSPIPLGY